MTTTNSPTRRLKKASWGYPIVSTNPAIQARYRQMREAGQSHNIAEMCAFQKAPQPKGTDRALLEGHDDEHGLGHLPPFMREIYIRQAKKAKIPIAGRVYKSCLADKRCGADPMAWVADSSDMLHVAKKRNKNLMGQVNYTADILDPTPDVRLAEPIVQRYSREILKREPMRDPREVREQVIAEHGAQE